MENELETCALCGEDAALMESHLFPKRLYRHMRDDRGRDPVAFDGGSAWLSSRQITARLLCRCCENLLSGRGETHVVGNCAREPGSFPLREHLLAASPVMEFDGFQIYDVSEIEHIDPEAYRHFAAGVYWKASVGKWKMGNRVLDLSSLGAYEGEFADYLLGRASFPGLAELRLHVAAETEPDRTLLPPCTRREHGAYRHKFYAHGLLFILYVGRPVSRRMVVPDLVRSERPHMAIYPFAKDSLRTGTIRLAKASRRRGRLASN